MMDSLSSATAGTIRNILFLCDKNEQCQKTRALLIEHGYRVVCAGTLQQALDILATTRIDIVFIDFAEAAGKVPQIEERLRHHLNGIPLIMAIDSQPYQPAQPFLFIQRPIDFEMLLRVVHSPAPGISEGNQDETQWLRDVNTSLRIENGHLHDMMTTAAHEWRGMLAQLDVLLAKLSHPGVGTLSEDQQIIVEQIRGVTLRMDEIVDTNL
jgi:DNA-binding NtrC family response regulator